MPQRKHFSGSDKVAVEFVYGHLLDPRSAWPDPHWLGFHIAFDDIVSGDVQVLGPWDEDPEREVTRRVIQFFLGNDPVPVMELTLHGSRLIKPYSGKRFPYWTVQKVWYRVNWRTGDESEVVERELLAVTFSGTSED